MLEQTERAPDALFVPVGGGGLISGIALAVRDAWPDTAIIGCLPAASPAMTDAVAAGRVVDSPMAPTLSDATAGNIEEGSITVPICSLLVDEWVLLEEDEIAAAMRSAAREHHLVVEGAGALALAASLRRGARTPARDRAERRGRGRRGAARAVRRDELTLRRADPRSSTR